MCVPRSAHLLPSLIKAFNKIILQIAPENLLSESLNFLFRVYIILRKQKGYNRTAL